MSGLVMSGGDFSVGLKSAVFGGISGAIFAGSELFALKSGLHKNFLSRTAVRSVGGGASNRIQGQKFKEGLVVSFVGEVNSWVYSKMEIRTDRLARASCSSNKLCSPKYDEFGRLLTDGTTGVEDATSGALLTKSRSLFARLGITMAPQHLTNEHISASSLI